MGSNSSNITDATTFQPSEPAQCANGCGFFSSAATNGFCSKCFREIRIHNLVNKFMSFGSQISLSRAEPVCSGSTGSEPVGVKKVLNRCLMCNKKVGVVGFMCKCGDVFCGSHRYPETHDCVFDFKRTGRDLIAKANPVVRADKLDRI